MKYTFHRRTSSMFLFASILIAGIGGYFLWVENPIAGALALLLAILYIEQGIHGEYVISDGRLTIHRGRILKDITIPIEQITAIHIIQRQSFCVFPKQERVVLVLKYKPRPITLIPNNAAQFKKALWKNQKH